MKRFIHIPKNAGTSVISWLETNKLNFICGNGSKRVGLHKYASHYKNESFEKFCVVRNPYSRIVSYFNFLTLGENWNLTFEQFVVGKYKSIKTKIGDPWDLQINWIIEDNIKIVDKILKFENIEEEIQEYFSCFEPFPQLNISTFDVYENYFTDIRLKKLIYEHFEKDFNILGYKK